MKYTTSEKKELRVKAIDQLLDLGWWPADIAAALSTNVNVVYKRTRERRKDGSYQGVSLTQFERDLSLLGVVKL